MDTLTKVLARHVYGLELDNLPLDRLTERKALKRAATKMSALSAFDVSSLIIYSFYLNIIVNVMKHIL